MDSFVPGLRETVIGLANALRVVVFFVGVCGIMLQVQQRGAEIEGLMRPIVRALVVVALVATLPHWFDFADRTCLTIADTVNEGYSAQPMRVAESLRATVTEVKSEFSLRRIGETVYQAMLYASLKGMVLVGSLIQLPFLVLQHVLKLLCYLFLPVALSMYLLPGQASLATRYVQQTLAVLAWPIGFAVTELVAYHLLTAYTRNLAVAVGVQAGEINAASMGSLLGGVLGSLWLVIGTLGTPFIMQALICSGTPVSGGGQSSLQQLYTIQQVAWMMKSVKTGGLALAAKGVAGGGGSSSPMNGLMPTTAAAAPVSPTIGLSVSQDPIGDRAAAAAIAAGRLPAPHTTI